MARIPRITSIKRQPTTRPSPYGSRTTFATGANQWMKATQNGTRPIKFAPAAPTPVSPVASGATSIGGSAQAAQADPRDAQYFNDIAKLEHFYAGRRADLQAAGESDARELQKSNVLLNEQQPKDTLSAKQNANKAGLFYSGFLGKNLGEIETSYARRRADLQSNYQNNQDTRARQLQDLEANYGPQGLNRNDILLGAAGRQSERDVALGVGSVPDVAAAGPKSPLPYKTQSAPGGVWHIYPGGRRVFVRK